MIDESEETRPWEDDIVALLEESKASVLGGVGDEQGSVGVHIVGGTINAMQERDAQKLFASFAVAAEDVAMPMPALELIWCSACGAQPPLGRLGLMHLRRHVFTVCVDRLCDMVTLHKF